MSESIEAIIRLKSMLYRAIVELEYVQNASDACGSDLCASAVGREIVSDGMRLLQVADLSTENWVSAPKGDPDKRAVRKQRSLWNRKMHACWLFIRLVWRKTGYFEPSEDHRIDAATAWDVAKTIWL